MISYLCTIAHTQLRGEHFDVLLEDATYGWCSRALVPLLNIALPPIHVSTIGLTQPWYYCSAVVLLLPLLVVA